jgi:hypothetical protein
MGVDRRITVQPILLAQLTNGKDPQSQVRDDIEDMDVDLDDTGMKPTNNASMVTFAPAMVLQPIAVSRLADRDKPIHVAPIVEPVRVNLPPVHDHWTKSLSAAPSAVTPYEPTKGLSNYSFNDPHYQVLFSRMVKDCGSRLWEKTRRDFLLRADHDGLSFFTGQKIQLSMKNLYKTLAKRGFALKNYPNNTPLPHHAGTHKWGGVAKGFSSIPEEWLNKVREQLADKAFPLHFEREPQLNGW